MNELKVFENAEFGAIRTVEQGGEPWFVGKDVAGILGYGNTKDALLNHVDEEDRVILQKSENATFEIPNRGMTIINESGLYSLILSSKLPTAKKFKHWVTADVLPSLRKHGLYAADELLNNPDLMIEAMQALKKERAENHRLNAKIEQDAPKVLFADSVSAAHTSILVYDLAKLIRQNGVDIGGNRLFGWLRDNGYLVRRKGTDYNMPTQKSMDMGLFEVKETAITHADGHTSVNRTPKVTGKGQVYFVQKFLGK